MLDAVARLRRTIAARSPESLVVGGFAALIWMGALLLLLPWSHRGDLRLVDALFTATSAVCVTGLVVVDTGREFTLFGQIVLLVLIQTGGIGVMSFAALGLLLLGRRLSLRAQAALGSTLLQRDVALEFRSIFGRILRFVLLAEVVGAALLFIGLAPTKGAAHAAYSAVFHAVSAFCNAGFSLYADSLSGVRDNPLVLVTVMALVVLGGIGHPVAVDVWRRLRARQEPGVSSPRRLSLSSKVVLFASGTLILAGVVLLLVLGLTPAEQSWPSRLAQALFQSVSARTAGFSTVDLGRIPLASLMLLVVLMFIGGSPASCAGGVKTTTFTLWLSTLWRRLRGKDGSRLFDRQVPAEITRRASMIIGLAVLWNLAGLLLLLAIERGTPGAGLHDVLFEQVSAFGTVGLSTGLTPRLGPAGKLWISATMFVGRLGPLTLAVWAFGRKAPGVRYPEERIMIG